ncbi:MAG TPA: mercuric transport protein MerTP [Puia sp.]
MNTDKLMGTGVFTAVASSLCCIIPVFSFIAGTGSIASSFSWLEPARPYLIGFTIAISGFVWYKKLKPETPDDCGCAVDEKLKFIQSRAFLSLVTLFGALMIAFPTYAKVFFTKNEKTLLIVENSKNQTVEINIKGMSCAGCEAEVNHAVTKLPGIIRSTVSYKRKNAIIQFDVSKTTIRNITDAVNSTGYKVMNYSLKN